MNLIKIPEELRKEWEGVKPLNPYFLAYPNAYFFEGTGFFRLGLGTDQMEGIVHGYLMFWFFLFALTPLLTVKEIHFLARIIFAVVWLIVLVGSILLFRKYYKAASEFVYKGKLLLGTIEEFTCTNHADFKDHAYYKVIYSFTTPKGRTIEGEGKSEYPQSKPSPIGRSIVILYLSDDKFRAL